MFDLITGPNRASARRDRIALGLIIGLGLGLLAPGAPAFGQTLPAANPESVGLSSERLARVTDALQAHIDAGHIAGVVAAVVRNGRLVTIVMAQLSPAGGRGFREEFKTGVYEAIIEKR